MRVQEVFREYGIDVHTADFLLNGRYTADQNVYFALGNVSNYKKVAVRDDSILSGLFHLEAPIIHPSTYRATREASAYFSRVYSFTTPDALEPFDCAGLAFTQFRIPAPRDAVIDEYWDRQPRKFLTMISQNRRPPLSWNELYSERPRALEHFSRTDSIDLYGLGWEATAYRVGEHRLPGRVRIIERTINKRLGREPVDHYGNVIRRVYRGPVESKYETMSGYTFALCFENMELDGWINEKIFDAFVVGTVPIYLGAPDVANYIPPECFIDPRAFVSYADLEGFLRSLGEREIRAYRENAREFMSSSQYYPFTKEAFAQLFVSAVEEQLGITL